MSCFCYLHSYTVICGAFDIDRVTQSIVLVFILTVFHSQLWFFYFNIVTQLVVQVLIVTVIMSVVLFLIVTLLHLQFCWFWCYHFCTHFFRFWYWHKQKLFKFFILTQLHSQCAGINISPVSQSVVIFLILTVLHCQLLLFLIVTVLFSQSWWSWY